MREHYTIYKLAIITSVVVFGIVATVIVLSISNEMNRISSGVIVDKEYYSGYSHSSGRTDSGGRVHYERDNRLPQYRFCIEGKKGGKIVRYWFDVPPAEYEKYSVGDTYSK